MVAIINEYESVRDYSEFRTRLLAFGTINGERYYYDDFDDDLRPGVIPQWFVNDATEAFLNTALRSKE